MQSLFLFVKPFFVFFENVYLYVISHKGTLRNIFIFRAVSGPIAILVNNQKTFDTDIISSPELYIFYILQVLFLYIF